MAKCVREQSACHLASPGAGSVTLHLGVTLLDVDSSKLPEADTSEDRLEMEANQYVVPLKRRRADFVLGRVIEPSLQVFADCDVVGVGQCSGKGLALKGP
jgi:hypothetical protein